MALRDDPTKQHVSIYIDKEVWGSVSDFAQKNGLKKNSVVEMVLKTFTLAESKTQTEVLPDVIAEYLAKGGKARR